MPPAYVEARAAMERGDLDAAAKAFEDQLAASPSDPVAKTGLAQVNLIRRVSSYDQARPAGTPPNARPTPRRRSAWPTSTWPRGGSRTPSTACSA